MMYRIRRVYLILAVLGVVLTFAACGSSGGAVEDIEPISSLEAQAARKAETTTEPTPTPADLPAEIAEPISPVSPLKEPEMSITGEVTPIPGSEEPLAAAIADLVEQSSVPAKQIKLVSMEAVQWSDTSLGCPQEGYMYAQVITPGYLIILEAQGQEYEYHTDRQTNFVLCQPE